MAKVYTPKLVLPSAKYKKSFFDDFLYAQGETGLDYKSWEKYQDLKILDNDFKGFIKLLKDHREGKNLKGTWVPYTIYWLVVGGKFIGMLSFRHKLNDNLRKIGGHIGYEISEKFQRQGYGKIILKLGLKKAKTFGLKKVLVTCDEANIGSKKIIEANGGSLENKVSQGKGKPKKLRYWIKL